LKAKTRPLPVEEHLTSRHHGHSIRGSVALCHHDIRMGLLIGKKTKLTLQMFVISGTGLGYIRYKNNGGKPMRRSVDDWDRQSK